MTIFLQEGSDASQLELEDWDHAFHGRSLDDRGEAAIGEIKKRSKVAYELHYDEDSFIVHVGSTHVHVDDLERKFSHVAKGNVVLEATTLGFVEILLCCRVLRRHRCSKIDVVYVEPESYRSPRRRHLLHRRDFELSKETPGYRGIPGTTYFLDNRVPHKCVFLLGYEESRLRRAFEDLQVINPSRTSLVFGVPAFRPGWEMDSIANNISVIREQKILGDLYYCGAENPAAIVEILEHVYSSLEPRERMFVAPIGTKPHGIGAAIFASTHPRVGILYDHPHRSTGRSSSLGNWHRYSIFIENRKNNEAL